MDHRVRRVASLTTVCVACFFFAHCGRRFKASRLPSGAMSGVPGGTDGGVTGGATARTRGVAGGAEQVRTSKQTFKLVPPTVLQGPNEAVPPQIALGLTQRLPALPKRQALPIAVPLAAVGGATGVASAFSQIDQTLRSLPVANIAFKVTDIMQLNTSSAVKLVLSLRESIPQLETQLREGITANEAVHGYQIHVAPLMDAELKGQAFQIQADTPEEQAVDEGSDTEWRWEVTPKRAGKQYLEVILNAILTVNGTSTLHSLRTFDSGPIQVNVSFAVRLSSLIGEHWEWFWGLVGSLFLGLWHIFVKKRLPSLRPRNTTGAHHSNASGRKRRPGH